MKQLLAACIYISALMLLAACSQESGTILAQKELKQEEVEIPQYDKIPEQQFNWITEDGGQSQLDFNPRVDVLFVSDNSDSMKSAQENLIKNLDRFTRGITSNRMIDYHIGVISTWDSSERFAAKKKDSFQIGDLRNIKNAKSQTGERRYVTKADNSSILAATLNIGVTPYAEGGPEVEEFFSPLAAALDKSGHGGTNEGFFREDAQLVVIFLTDADDSTARISPEQMAKTLVDFKGGKADKVSVYGVLVKGSDADQYKDWDLRVHPKYHPECFDMTAKTPKNNGRCTGFGPERLEQLVVAANVEAGTPEQIREKYIMSIVSKSFGSDLAKIGDSITVKTLAKEIFLSQRPRVDSTTGQLMVRVRYGSLAVLAAGKGQLIPRKDDGGWKFDAENNSVKLSGNIKYEYVEGGRFAVDLVPVTLAK